MGAHSTLRITRSKAREYLFSTLLSMGDDSMEELLDRELSDRLYRVRIVDDNETENDDEAL
jgi:hypothetical protein